MWSGGSTGVIALNSGNLKTECVRVSYNYQTTSQTFPKHIHHHTYVKTAIYLLVLLNETISLLLCNPVEIPINLGDKQPEIFWVFFFWFWLFSSDKPHEEPWHQSGIEMPPSLCKCRPGNDL